MNILEYQRARYPYLWLTTTEEERTIRQHRAQLPDKVNLIQWDIAQGFTALSKNGSGYTWKPVHDEPITDPGEALTTVLSLPQNTVFYFKDFHRFFNEPTAGITIIRRAANLKDTLKATARLIVFIASERAIPPELRNDIIPFTPPLPTKEELKATVKRISSDNNRPEPGPQELEAISNSLIGLTEEAAENALSLCLVRNKTLDPKILNREKARLIESIAGLTYSEYNESFDDLAGLETLISYILKAAPHPLSNAILLYGIPGTGKSHTAKATGNALKWPVIGFNLNNVRSKYQGETEGNLEKALQTIEAIGRCIVFVDEIDKSIAGTGESDADAGTGARIIGRLLSYFADRPEGGAYWIMTCNSLTDILTISGGALVRRFDALFFLDLPSKRERDQIIKIWSKKFKVEIPTDFNTEGFTGADIAKLTRTMKLLNCTAEEARKYVIPTKQALGPRIDEIRKAALNVCIPASPREDTTASAAPRVRKLEL